jgi:hypothetical protein
MRLRLALCLLVAGCHHEVPVSNGGASEAQIQRVSTPKVVVVDTRAAARPQPLTAANLAGSGMSGPPCDFSRDGRMLLAVSAADAIANVAGTLRHFVHASPAGPTGGFFEDRQVSISVGRVGEVVPGESTAGSWPGRMTVTNRRAHAQIELEGLWRCGS